MKEAKITEDVKDFLEDLKKKNLVRYYKVSDRYTSGLADFIGCFIGGRMFHIELKAPGEKLRKLQAYTLWEFNQCHAAVLGTSSIDEVKAFIMKGIKEGKKVIKPPLRSLDWFLNS